jgi:hypothetical protein
MQAAVAQQMEAVWEISDIAERYGQISYEFQPHGLARQMDICGLRLQLQGNLVTRVTAADMDLQLHWHIPANNNATLPAHGATMQFKHGNREILADWVSRLQKYCATCVA